MWVSGVLEPAPCCFYFCNKKEKWGEMQEEGGEISRRG